MLLVQFKVKVSLRQDNLIAVTLSKIQRNILISDRNDIAFLNLEIFVLFIIVYSNGVVRFVVDETHQIQVWLDARVAGILSIVEPG
jgi:hypothetical protein